MGDLVYVPKAIYLFVSNQCVHTWSLAAVLCVLPLPSPQVLVISNILSSALTSFSWSKAGYFNCATTRSLLMWFLVAEMR